MDKTYNLLIIDDDEIGNMYLGMVLSDLSYIREYKFENSGWDGLEYLDQTRSNFPDLILVDLNMPEMDGFDFIEKYEQKFYNDFPETRLLVMTNSILEIDKKKSLQFRSVCQFINKPITVEALLQALGASTI